VVGIRAGGAEFCGKSPCFPDVEVTGRLQLHRRELEGRKEVSEGMRSAPDEAGPDLGLVCQLAPEVDSHPFFPEGMAMGCSPFV
jgi:hypothetical protein